MRTSRHLSKYHNTCKFNISCAYASIYRKQADAHDAPSASISFHQHPSASTSKNSTASLQSKAQVDFKPKPNIALMFAPKPEDPSDLSPPDELAQVQSMRLGVDISLLPGFQALSIWARHSAGAASRGAQAAAYARSQVGHSHSICGWKYAECQATIAHHMAYQAAQKIRELDDNECVQKYSEEFERQEPRFCQFI